MSYWDWLENFHRSLELLEELREEEDGRPAYTGNTPTLRASFDTADLSEWI
jgi:hypothetical protein